MWPLLLLSLWLSPATSLQCYTNLCPNQAELCIETCPMEDDVCIAIYIFGEHGGLETLGTFGCSRRHSECDAAQCHISISAGFHSCCCDSNLCNVVGGLTDHALPAPPTPSVTPPPEQEGMVICEVNNCTLHTTDMCYHGYRLCQHCTATYRSDNRRNYKLVELGCSLDPQPDPQTMECALDTRMEAPSQAECSCSKSFCNRISNIVFTDQTHVAPSSHIDAVCEQIGCSHACIRLSAGAPPICRCQKGFALAQDDTNCVDIDECALGINNCSEQCVNTVGGHQCACPSPGKVLSLVDYSSCVDFHLSCARNVECENISDPECNLQDCPPNADACLSIWRENGTALALVPIEDGVTCHFIHPGVQFQECTPDTCHLERGGGSWMPGERFYTCCCTTTGCTSRGNTIFPVEPETTTPTVDATTLSTDEVTLGSNSLSAAAHGALIGVFVFIIVIILMPVALILFYCYRRRKHSTGGGSAHLVEYNSEPIFRARLDPATVRLGDWVGAGRFGSVHTATSTDPNYSMTLAVKVCKAKESYLQELKMYTLPGFTHPNILKFLGSQENPLWIITEFHATGSLYDVLKKGQELTEQQGFNLAYSFTTGLSFLHSISSNKQEIAHRDLKSSNLLVKDWGTSPVCVISDFGLAITLPTDEPVGQVGTPRYMAPELLECTINHTLPFRTVDMYACALILWELLSRTRPANLSSNHPIGHYSPPYDEYLVHSIGKAQPTISDMDHLFKVDSSRRPTIPAHWKTEPKFKFFCDSITEAWCENPAARVSANCITNRFQMNIASTTCSNGEINFVHENGECQDLPNDHQYVSITSKTSLCSTTV